jgi:hypothetical protein
MPRDTSVLTANILRAALEVVGGLSKNRSSGQGGGAELQGSESVTGSWQDSLWVSCQAATHSGQDCEERKLRLQQPTSGHKEMD